MVGIIAARSINNVIGKDGKIPWKIKGEQAQFKELTIGNVVVMGRRSFEEIGRALPNRKTIVVSNNKVFEGENLATVGSVKEAIDLAGDEKVFIAGGYGLYKEAMPYVDVMYITEVKTYIENGDVFFPDFNKEDFDVEIGESAGDDIEFTRVIYRRRNK
ncbi:dihydrofolate reductase [Eubacterium uniforme]|uniref:Dihydrofolate reductase n=1 Tax=Eubacterium uniforme TaxID=39495 RepID=A0A1T4VQJ1_9FIRM|nr:dihydrofolate reductase [Eubacterium uniforme]SKA67145.1 dihydrofolate reductase [Eubacterium uniforme]